MTEEQWLAIKNKDRNYDGVFFYGLKTTKILCRPSCPSRPCRAKNVIIFQSLEDGLEKGFRPCLRCRPDELEWNGAREDLVKKAKAYVEKNYRKKFSLEDIAGALFVNKSYLLRSFKSLTGITLLQYHNCVRCLAAKELLARPELTISYISNAVGYSTASHFSKVFKKTVGCTPFEYRNSYFTALEKM